MSRLRETRTPLNIITSRKMSPKDSMVFPAAFREKSRASIPSRLISNMDRVSADRPKEASTPSASPAPRETRPMTPVSRNSNLDTCPWDRPRSR